MPSSPTLIGKNDALKCRSNALLLMFVGLIISAQVLAQTPSIRFSTLSLDDGLSQATVTAAAQDQAGFMWFGTQDGLNRFDGYEFVQFKHDPRDPSSLRSNSIFSLYADPEGGIWVGTEGGGLSHWDTATESFKHYDAAAGAPEGFENERIRAITRDSSGVLWVGLHESGLYRFDEANATWTVFSNDPEDSASLSDDRVRAIHEDRTGRLWIGTREGLNLFDRSSEKFTWFKTAADDPDSLSDNKIRSIVEDRQGRLWIGTLGGGLNRFDRSTGTFERLMHDENDPSSLSENRIRAIMEDRKGQIWVGTEKGINLLQENGTFARYGHDPQDATSLSKDRVTFLFQDRTDVIWVGSAGGGLDRWHPLDWSFGHFKSGMAGLSNGVVHAFTEDNNGSLYVGTLGGLNVLDRQNGENRVYRNDPQDPTSLSGDRITALLYDSHNALWVGTVTGGLNRRLEGTDQFEHFTADESNPGSLPSNVVMTVYQDRRGTVWVGTYGGGLSKFDYDTGQFSHFQSDPDDPLSISGNQVSTIAEDASGALWVGTLGDGLNYFEPESGQFLRVRHEPGRNDSLSSDEILSLHMDQGGVLWVGTQGGGLNRLNRFEGDATTFTRYSEYDGLPNDVVYGILPDADGGLWLSTIHGLARFSPGSESFETFNATDGLQANEFNMGGSFRSQSGELFFGGVNGFNAFYPGRIERNQSVPELALTSFLKLNEPVSTESPVNRMQKLDLSYKDYVVSFSFAALDFRSSRHNQYAYKLEGLDQQWIELGNRNEITFTNLAPGAYTLRVRGSNSDGIWNESGISLPISVEAPPWQQWWAYLLYTLVVLFIIWRFVLNQQQKKRTQETLRQAAIDAQAANDAKSEFLANMSHEIRTPMNGVLGMANLLNNTKLNESQREQLDIIRKSGDSLLDVINEILDYSKIESREVQLEQENFDLRTTIEDVLDILAPIAAQKGLDLGYWMEPGTPELVIGDRLRIRQVLINLVSNGIKFTEDGEVMISISASHRDGNMAVVHMAVEDSGTGIPANRLDRLFKPFSQVDNSASRKFQGTGLGLAISKRLAELMGGKLWVESVEGKGSSFHFTFLVEPLEGNDRAFLHHVESHLNGKRILIVDDSLAMRDLLSQQTTTWGMRAQTASSAAKALENLWAGGNFDLVLIDPLGLSSTGTEWIKDMADLCATKQIPIITVTARTNSNQSVKEELGAITSVSKPVQPEFLLEALRSVTTTGEGHEKEESQLKQASRKLKATHPLKILLAEDNPINRRVALLLLDSIGYQAHAVENGLEVLEAMKTAPYDVVLMDVQMPEMDGFETSRTIWREYPDKQRPYIIAMTAHAMWGDRERCLAAGMDSYISKPIDVGDLYTVLSQVPVNDSQSVIGI